MLDFLDEAAEAINSTISSVVAEILPAMPTAVSAAPAQVEGGAVATSAAAPATEQAAPSPASEAAAGPAPVQPTATDEHHDWLKSVLGFDVRSYAASVLDGDGTSDSARALPSSGGASAGAGGAGAGDGAGGAGSGPPAAQPAEGDGWTDDLLHVVGLGKRAEREERVENAVAVLGRMKEEDIQKLSTDERLKLLADLSANGDPTSTARGMQKRLYNNTPIDPAQQAVDDARSDAIAKAVAGDKELQAAQANWATLTGEQRAAALRKVVAAQSKAMGMDAPEIVIENGMQEGGMTVSGVYRDDDGKLHLNMDPDSMTANFPQAVSIATHENTHHYQAELVKRLQSGTLNPGDPEYDQARLFAANNATGGYINPSEGARTEDEQRDSIENYKNQPVERHAWNNGSATAVKVDGALKGARGVQQP